MVHRFLILKQQTYLFHIYYKRSINGDYGVYFS
nr:MAG TPA: hypothetical protein [Crassvirales sp.]